MTAAGSIAGPLSHPRIAVHPLALVLCFAAAIRLPLALIPNVHVADEIFQILEPAWRLLGHDSIVTWEWREGIRPWLLPALMAGPVAIGDWLVPGGTGAFTAPRLVASLASLSIVACAYLFGARISKSHALVAGLVAAIWFELVYFAPHTLSETLATAAILPAAWLLTQATPSSRQVIAAGALLALAFVIRFHYAPAMLVLVAWTCGRQWRRLGPLAAGGVSMLVASGAVDAANGTIPFAWIVENVRHNIALGRAATFGIEPATIYLTNIHAFWSLAIIPMAFAIWRSLRYVPLLLAMAAINIAVHSAIGHKEYRFIFLSLALLVIAAAIGSADWAAVLARRKTLRRFAVPAIVGGWTAISLSLAVSDDFRGQWTNGLAGARIATELRNDSAVCGLAIYEMPFFLRLGRERLAGRKPLYSFAVDDTSIKDGVAAAANAAQAGFNRIVARRDMRPAVPATFARGMCVPNFGIPVCIYARPGPCDAAAASRFDVNDVLTRLNY